MRKQEFDIAKYQVIADAGGKRFRFFCDLSGLAVHTTAPIRAKTDEEALQLAWQEEGKQHFNVCHKCGKYVCDAMYNADVLECVACAPWEELPAYCSHCGAKLSPEDTYCRVCGKKLRYGEVNEHDDTST